ncbi:class I glutamine amidotransferase-like protein [Podospora fimiseda]|uniref:Class I glutamine amidotransferase-like protein n=1 Tax=Podospora fimiseda TaxID=252190 RepID=A0AAN7BHD2_9PEZI|nr:class I glutamine amidotransferase-like protein [Podospora fimiseda]
MSSTPNGTTPTPNKSLRIGVMLEQVQLSDIISIDIFGNLSQAYLSQLKSLTPDGNSSPYSHFESQALDITWYYIATTLEPTVTTPPIFTSTPGQYGGFTFVPNTTYDTCPRDLDILLIGGPLPSFRPPQADKFMKEAWFKTRVWMTTCVGSVWAASAGLLEGKKVTTNKAFLEFARQSYPGTEWKYQRWVVDEKEYEGEGGGKGELWTSGGAGTGIDMVGEYCLKNFGREFVDTMALEGLEFNPGGKGSMFFEKGEGEK